MDQQESYIGLILYLFFILIAELTTAGKVKRVLWDYIGRFVCLLGFLYLFICSLDFLSSAFRLLGGKIMIDWWA